MSLDNQKDMLKKKCKKCKRGRYYEWHYLCDRGDYPLRCDNCDHETQRWVKKKMKKKKKKKLEDAGWTVTDVDGFLGKPLRETVVKRLLIDKEFKKGLEKEIIDAILREEYYMAHEMLKDLVEYKERREES
jgi:hypothetical protein